MRAWLALALAATGCVGNEDLVVFVQTAAEKPIAGATVACTCDPYANGAALTGPDGIARVALFATDHEPCVVTVFAPGYATRQIAEVDPAVGLDVELEVGP